jgi:predicted permease
MSLARAQTFNHDLAERLRTLPAVSDVTPVFGAPLAQMHEISQFSPAGHEPKLPVEFNVVGADFFSSLGIPLVRGRGFGEADIQNGGVAIVNETVARQFWPGQDPVGQRIEGGMPGNKQSQVIGVARDVQVAELGDAHKPFIYLPAIPADQLDVHSMMVRTRGDARNSVALIGDAARSLDRGVKIDVMAMHDNIDQWVAPARICVVLAATLGGLGLLLVSIGIYGTVSYSVTRRVREIGIRMTLGARPADVLRVVLKRSLRPVILGAPIGVLLCLGVGRILRMLLFGISPLDPIAYVSVAAFLFAVALLASYLPARRALRVDPMRAIRHE